MQIFYAYSYYGKEEYQPAYDLVLTAIQQTGANVIVPEIDNYLEELTVKELSQADDNPNYRHYLSIQKGIQTADAAIFEISHQDFQLGWEAAWAIANKKPVLTLSIHEDFSNKISHPRLQMSMYDETTINSIVQSFVAKINQPELNKRFNFYLSETQLDYLEKQAQANDLSTAAYLRSLIDQSKA